MYPYNRYIYKLKGVHSYSFTSLLFVELMKTPTQRYRHSAFQY